MSSAKPNVPDNNQNLKYDIFGLSFLWKDFDAVHELNIEKINLRWEMQKYLEGLGLNSFELTTKRLPGEDIIKTSGNHTKADVIAWKKLLEKHEAIDVKRLRYTNNTIDGTAPKATQEDYDIHQTRIQELINSISSTPHSRLRSKSLTKKQETDLDNDVLFLKTLLEKSGRRVEPSQLPELEGVKELIVASEERLRTQLGRFFEWQDTV